MTSTVLMVRTTQMDSKIPDLSFQVLHLEKLMSMHHAIAYLYNNLKPRRRKRRGVTWSLEDSPQEPGSPHKFPSAREHCKLPRTWRYKRRDTGYENQLSKKVDTL